MSVRCSNTARARSGSVPRLIVLVPLLALLGGCSMWNSMFGDKDPILPDEPADRLYNQGVYLLNEKKDFREAAKKFEEVDRQHPYSEWAARRSSCRPMPSTRRAPMTNRSTPPSATSRCIPAAPTRPTPNT